MSGNKEEFFHHPRQKVQFFFSLISACLSLHSDPRCKQTQIVTSSCVCLSCFLPPYPPFISLSLSLCLSLPSPPPALWQLCWWWLCARGASWLWGPRWPTWQLLMFRCSAPLTQGPWSHTHTHTLTHSYRDALWTITHIRGCSQM